MNEEIKTVDRENANPVEQDEPSRADQDGVVLERIHSEKEIESSYDVVVDNAEVTDDAKLAESNQEMECINVPENVEEFTISQNEVKTTICQSTYNGQAVDDGQVADRAQKAVKCHATAKDEEIESKLITGSENIEKLTVHQNRANRTVSSAAVDDHVVDCARASDEAKSTRNELQIESKLISEPNDIGIMVEKVKNELSSDYPTDMTTRFGLEHGQATQDDIQNLKVTLVPIKNSLCSRRIKEKGTPLPRPQSPVCDFIQRVILESYV